MLFDPTVIAILQAPASKKSSNPVANGNGFEDAAVIEVCVVVFAAMLVLLPISSYVLDRLAERRRRRIRGSRTGIERIDPEAVRSGACNAR